MTPILAITVGDMNGIGPEVALKGVRSYRGNGIPFLLGPLDVFRFYAARCGIPLRLDTVDPRHDLRHAIRKSWKSHRIPVIDFSPIRQRISIEPGALSATAGRVAGSAITEAVRLVLDGSADAIITAPVSKAALHKAGYRWPGQTEMIQKLSHSPHVAMVLVCEKLLIGLVTIHLPLKHVARAISRRLIRDRITTLHRALRSDWRIGNPKMAVLGLNPHAGEQGELGEEEDTHIIPALRSLRKEGIRLEGPFPADGFFAHYQPGTYDAVIAMYHDQGLIPLKMLARGRGVNVSVGLKIVRTSPDHGTAFDIAGRNLADPSSMQAAMNLAEFIVTNRRRRSL